MLLNISAITRAGAPTLPSGISSNKPVEELTAIASIARSTVQGPKQALSMSRATPLEAFGTT